jgi:signal transduction histidine kinase
LLHWAKGQMNGTVTENSNFNLNMMLEELMFLYMPLIKNKDINIELKTEYHGLVVADKNQINLVLRNLIDNAIKFTPIGGKIVLVIRPVKAEINFSIENETQHNHEITMDNLRGEKIAVSTYGTQNESGVGLGLLLCHDYIKNNGSVIQTDLNGNMIKFSFHLASLAS